MYFFFFYAQKFRYKINKLIFYSFIHDFLLYIRETRAYASSGISYSVAENQKVYAGVDYRQSNFKSSRDSLTAQLGYTMQF
jgi:hypothetical protein